MENDSMKAILDLALFQDPLGSERMKLRLTTSPAPPRAPGTLGFSYPEEGVQGAILHELGDDHHGCALGDHTLQMDDVGMIKLAHDGGLAQEVPPLFLSVARLECLDGYKDLSLAWQFQVATAYFTKLPWDRHTERGRMSLGRWKCHLPVPCNLYTWGLQEPFLLNGKLILLDTELPCRMWGASKCPSHLWEQE